MYVNSKAHRDYRSSEVTKIDELWARNGLSGFLQRLEFHANYFLTFRKMPSTSKYNSEKMKCKTLMYLNNI